MCSTGAGAPRGGGVVGLVGHPAEDRHAADAERPALGHEHVDPAPNAAVALIEAPPGAGRALRRSSEMPPRTAVSHAPRKRCEPQDQIRPAEDRGRAHDVLLARPLGDRAAVPPQGDRETGDDDERRPDVESQALPSSTPVVNSSARAPTQVRTTPRTTAGGRSARVRRPATTIGSGHQSPITSPASSTPAASRRNRAPTPMTTAPSSRRPRSSTPAASPRSRPHARCPGGGWWNRVRS